ncbi:MAG: hypothetical protein M4579_001674 [Chaenotheca gracillima]|nr:MAG: hypothetical protein M4579_001674 [Chaenotheca gracillima]
MAPQPPFLYDPPSRRNNSPYGGGFNPKAASQASFHVLPPRPKQEGPLINFNRHPDSYVTPPYGNLNARPMSSHTRKGVKYLRWTQLFLRCCELVGAIGALMALICLRKIDTIMGWILRIPPGVAVLHTIYAIYHLARSASSRTPGSSASYMLFAATADASVIPFYILCGLTSKTQISRGKHMQWTSVFNDSTGTAKILQAAYLLGVVDAALHVLSFILSIYLAIIFRKISQLPPDMNPLEDNLTSRHKKKNSNISNLSEKRSSQATGSSAAISTNASHLEDPLIAPPRTVPFMHTRNGSSDSLSLDQKAVGSKRSSRADLPSQIQQYNNSARSSRVDLSRSSGTHSPAKRYSQYNEPTRPKHPSRQALLNDNWYTYIGNAETQNTEDGPEMDVASVKDFRRSKANNYRPLNSEWDDIPHPLESNPPTPPPGTKRGLRVGNLNRVQSLKAKFYGDLKSATPPIMVGPSENEPVGGGNWRVVSNSGTDFEGSRREVSGKVAEEGRGGAWTRFRKVSGV